MYNQTVRAKLRKVWKDKMPYNFAQCRRKKESKLNTRALTIENELIKSQTTLEVAA